MQKGFKIELELKNNFHLKYYHELDRVSKTMIDIMFGNFDKRKLIISGYCKSYYKPDIFIEIDGIRKYISIKSGKTNSLHFELIKTLTQFIRSIGISTESQKTLLLYHYGDKTLNGTGDIRYNCDYLLKALKDRIHLLNNELNKKWIVRLFLDRFLFVGLDDGQSVVDFICFINGNNIVLTSRQELINFVQSRSYKHINNPHIGPMIIQPYLRDVERKSSHPRKRQKVQIKWWQLEKDLFFASGIRIKIK